MKIYDRRTKEYEEIAQYGQGALNFLYGNFFGRVLLRLAVSPSVSRLYGYINSKKSSVKRIPGFISSYNINMDDYEDREYTSFNDFFARKLRPGARPIDEDPKRLISPADSKLLVYTIEDDLRIEIKGRTYSLPELLSGSEELSKYSGGLVLVYRLCVDDFHRYGFPDNGKLISQKTIRGKFHTVSPVSKDYKIYKENHRVVSFLSTEHFGEVIHIEVGAMLIGKIVNRDVKEFSKGEEKGYFEPGGSTIIEIFEKDSVRIDEDILTHSRDHIETKVKFGEGVGTAC
ncbi:MAG: phosphatidylserine decarboxylase [Lachnospiraceae bacterium]|nr:phosphatidylserine decarboxylase [Lachnospiraceae bacterium]